MGDWQSIVAAKQKHARALVPPEWRLPESIISFFKWPLDQNPTNLIALDIPRKSGILTSKELDITESYDVRDLLGALSTGKFSSEEVVTAFCKRAAIAQELTQCLTETYYSQAIERARFLDNFRAKEGKAVGPLHGLPISIKDMFDVKGSDSSIGFVSMVDKPKAESAVIVSMLEALGAVIYVKTNVPQTMMLADSSNNVFGKVLNPHNTALGAGGSSGGEGALVAMRGSLLGVGTDIGGSIRIPGLCCGTYAFKPTSSRIPTTGWTIPMLEGFGTIIPGAGPLAHSIDSLEIFMKVVLDARPSVYDTVALDIPWRTLDPPLLSTRLTIGVLSEDPMYPLHPPVRRALADAVRRLQAQGHTMIPLPAPDCHVADAGEVCWAMFQLETETTIGHILASGEPVIEAISNGRCRPANEGKFTFVPDLSGMDFAHKMAALNIRRYMIEDDWRKMWYSNRLDVVIGPGAQNTAVKHDMRGFVPYTVFLNLLNYPACIIPFGRASKDIDAEPMRIDGSGEARGGYDYIPAEVDGAPCHVQVFTRSLQDEECLRCARIIDQCLNGT